MPRSKRSLFLSITAICCVILVVAVGRVAWSWKNAYTNIQVMMVPTVVLPTFAPAPTETPEQGIHQNNVPEPTLAPEATAEPLPTPDIEAPNAPINILLLGTDARPGDEVSRTDAVIVVHIDPTTDKISLLSLPRDLWVPIPGYGRARINAAYPIGEKQFGKDKGYGAALAKKTVSDLLKIPIHHFMLMNFEGFKTLIDQVGGVYIDVPKAISDPAYPTENYGTIKVRFDAGRQFMDSDRALIYARTRHADNDFGRNQRQQQVLMAIFDRMRQQGILSQLTALDNYTAALRDYIRTDLSRDDMLSIASLGPRLRSSNIQRYAIEPKMLVELQPPATFSAEPKALRQLVAQMVDGSSSAAGGEKPTP